MTAPSHTYKPSWSLQAGPPRASQQLCRRRVCQPRFHCPTIASRPKTLRPPAKRTAAVPRQLRMFPALRAIGAGVTRAHHLISVYSRCRCLPMLWRSSQAVSKAGSPRYHARDNTCMSFAQWDGGGERGKVMGRRGVSAPAAPPLPSS